MIQCLHINFVLIAPKKFLQTVQKKAQELELEGTARTSSENQVTLVVCGQKDSINTFVDVLYQEAAKALIQNLSIEPMLKGKDYRGVFRIIE